MPVFGSDRSVRAGGNITGSVVTTGNGNRVTARIHVTLPPAHSVDPKAELVALHEALGSLAVPERDKMERAFLDAEDEVAKPAPDKEDVGGAVQRVLKAAKGANGFAEQVEKLAPRIAALASWVGPAGEKLLSLVGLST